MKFKDGIPIYLQLTQEIANLILSGEYKPGERIQSVRELALVFGVNPNTVQKALVLAEELGLVFAHGPEGRFVSEDERLITRLRKEAISKEVKEFLERLRQLGISRNEVIDYLKEEESEV